MPPVPRQRDRLRLGQGARGGAAGGLAELRRAAGQACELGQGAGVAVAGEREQRAVRAAAGDDVHVAAVAADGDTRGVLEEAARFGTVGAAARREAPARAGQLAEHAGSRVADEDGDAVARDVDVAPVRADDGVGRVPEARAARQPFTFAKLERQPAAPAICVSAPLAARR